MFLSKDLSELIVTISFRYLGRPFDWDTFNCVHFVRKVYGEVGISLPLLVRGNLPPPDFHLSMYEFALMPIGHSVFFKRRASKLERYWTHVAIVVGPDKLIHCTRNLGSGVIISSKSEFMEIYDLAPKTLK